VASALAVWLAQAVPAAAERAASGPTSCPDRPAATVPWDLPRLALYTLCHNPQSQAQRAAARLNEGRPDTDDALGRAPIDVSVNVTRTDTTMPTVRTDNGNPGVASSVGSNLASKRTEGIVTTNRTAIVQGTYSIYDFGAELAQRARARYQEDAAAAALDATEQTLLRELVMAWLEALPDGRKPRDELVTAPVAALMGWDPLVPVRLAPPVRLWFEPPGRWENWWAAAERRPDLRAAQARVMADQEGITSARAADKGKVGLALSLSPGYSNVTGRTDAESLNLTYTVPLGQLEPVAPAVQTAAARLRENRQGADAARDRARLEVQAAWDAYRTAFRHAADTFGWKPAAGSAQPTAWAPSAAGILGPLVAARVELLRVCGVLTVAALTRPVDALLADAAPVDEPKAIAAPQAVPAEKPAARRTARGPRAPGKSTATAQTAP
jgi:outer membrane protein TolC